MASAPYSDGGIHLTTISSEALAAIFDALHTTLHREGVTDPLTAKERALYDAIVEELTARAGDVKRAPATGSPKL